MAYVDTIADRFESAIKKRSNPQRKMPPPFQYEHAVLTLLFLTQRADRAVTRVDCLHLHPLVGLPPPPPAAARSES